MSESRAGHRSDEITSYLSETLDPEERATFEAHLGGCEECRRELAAQKALFAQVNEVLAVKPKRTIEEQVARFEKMVAAERAEKRRRLAWQIPLGLAIAASLAVVAANVLHRPVVRPSDLQAAPRKP